MAWEDIAKIGLSVAGGAAGAIGGPAGVAIGSALGGALGEWIFDDEEETSTRPSVPPGFPTQPGMATSGLAFGGGTSGGGGSGSTFLPPSPGGDLVGPVYGTQGGLIPAAASALSTVLQLLQSYPVISDFLQRRWNFPTESVVSVPKSEALWAALARQVPASHRDALEQFLVGFPAPVGLSKASSDVFLTLMIAESGYSPEALGCCKGGK